MAPLQRAGLPAGSQSRDIQAAAADRPHASPSTSAQEIYDTLNHIAERASDYDLFLEHSLRLLESGVQMAPDSSSPLRALLEQMLSGVANAQGIQNLVASHIHNHFIELEEHEIDHHDNDGSAPPARYQGALTAADAKLQLHNAQSSGDDQASLHVHNSSTQVGTSVSAHNIKEASEAEAASSDAMSESPTLPQPRSLDVISCDLSVGHVYCPWCAILYNTDYIEWKRNNHPKKCYLNPVERRKAEGSGFEMETCDSCKYLIPSEYREDHAKRCVYKGAKLPSYKRMRTGRYTEFLSPEDIIAQFDAGQVTPAYFTQACHHCYDSDIESSCDRTLGCQNCGAKGVKCEYDFGNYVLSLHGWQSSEDGLPLVTYSDLKTLRWRSICFRCEENETEPCVKHHTNEHHTNERIGACLHCLENGFLTCTYTPRVEDDRWFETLLCTFDPFECEINDSKLEAVRKQRQAIWLANDHFYHMYCKLAEAARLRTEAKMSEQAKAQVSKTSAQKRSKTKQSKTPASKEGAHTQAKAEQSKTTGRPPSASKQKEIKQSKPPAVALGASLPSAVNADISSGSGRDNTSGPSMAFATAAVSVPAMTAVDNSNTNSQLQGKDNNDASDLARLSGPADTPDMSGPEPQTLDQWLDYVRADGRLYDPDNEPHSDEPSEEYLPLEMLDDSDADTDPELLTEYTDSNADDASVHGQEEDSQPLTITRWLGDETYKPSEDEDEDDSDTTEEVFFDDDLDLLSVASSPRAGTSAMTTAARITVAEPLKKRRASDSPTANTKRMKSSEDATVEEVCHNRDVLAELPPGWVAYHDDRTGKTHYANNDTETVTWKKPT